MRKKSPQSQTRAQPVLLKWDRATTAFATTDLWNPTGPSLYPVTAQQVSPTGVAAALWREPGSWALERVMGLREDPDTPHYRLAV